MIKPAYRKLNNNKRGVNLVEILIALTVGVMAFFPIIQLFQAGIRDSMHSTAWTQARELAKSYIDRVISMQFSQIARGQDQIVDGGIKLFPKTDIIKNTKFETTCLVHDLVPMVGATKYNNAGIASVCHYCISGKLKAITVTVSWPGTGRDASGAPIKLTYSLVTFKADLFEGTKSDIWTWP